MGDQSSAGIDPVTQELLGGGFSGLGLVLSLALIGLGQLLLLTQRFRVRVGFDGGWALGRYGRLARSAGGAGLCLVLLHGVGSRLSTPWALGLLAAVLITLVISGVLQNAVAGLQVQLRLQLHEGDRIRVGALAGELLSLHWDHVQLIGDDGETHYVPNHALTREPVQVQALRHAVPLELRVAGAADTDPASARLTVALSPYRIPGTPIRVEREADALVIHCMTWSRDARRAAQLQLTQQLADADGMGEPPPA